MVTSERREALLQAAAHWRAYAETLTQGIGANAAIAAAVSLEREAEDGVARCSCCMKPFGQGTLHR